MRRLEKFFSAGWPAHELARLSTWNVDLLVSYEPGGKRLKSEKDQLLDVNEKLLRDKEEMERHESYLALRLFYAEHPELETFRCHVLSDDEVIYSKMNKLRTVKRASKREQHQQAIKDAMPEVRKLCERYGRSIVSGCVSRITAFEKKSAQVERLKAEAAALEKKLMDEGANAMAV